MGFIPSIFGWRAPAAKGLDPYRDRFDALQRRAQGFGALTRPTSPFGRGGQRATLADVLRRERRATAPGAGVPRQQASAAELRQLFFTRSGASLGVTRARIPPAVERKIWALVLKSRGVGQQPRQGVGRAPAARKQASGDFAYNRVA